MIKDILTLLGMFIAGALFIYLKDKIFKNVKTQVKDKINTKKRKAKMKKDDIEVFEWKKFKKMFDLGSKVEWIKSIKEIIDLRKLAIYSLILGVIFGFGYFKGRGNTPIKTNLDYDKEFIMSLNGEYLYKGKYSNDIYVKDTKTDKILKHIKAKDMPLLKKKLKPIGFILEPIVVIGGGLGLKGADIEGGAGVSFVKYWRWKLDTFLTNKGFYVGTSYRITDNSGLGIGAGKGYKGDNRAIIYYNWKF